MFWGEGAEAGCMTRSATHRSLAWAVVQYLDGLVGSLLGLIEFVSCLCPECPSCCSEVRHARYGGYANGGLGHSGP